MRALTDNNKISDLFCVCGRQSELVNKCRLNTRYSRSHTLNILFNLFRQKIRNTE